MPGAAIHCEYNHHTAVQAIEDAYKKDRRMCSFPYDQSKLVVDSLFDQRQHQLEMETTVARQQIELQPSVAFGATKRR